MLYKLEIEPNDMQMILKGLHELPAKESLNTISRLTVECMKQEEEYKKQNEKEDEKDKKNIKKIKG